MKFNVIKASKMLDGCKAKKIDISTLEELVEWFKDKGEITMNVHIFDDESEYNDPYLIEIQDD